MLCINNPGNPDDRTSDMVLENLSCSRMDDIMEQLFFQMSVRFLFQESLKMSSP